MRDQDTTLSNSLVPPHATNPAMVNPSPCVLSSSRICTSAGQDEEEQELGEEVGRDGYQERE